MMSHFPVFMDFRARPPLIIGDDDGLVAKLRLLRKAAPVVEVLPITPAGWHQAAKLDPAVRLLPPCGALPATRDLAGPPYDRRRVMRLMIGRPLVIVATSSPEIDRDLSTIASDREVPVNVPDKPALCSVYLGAIVDRAPVVIAISTSGKAPVLGQLIRARLESMLSSDYGRLAGFMADVKARLGNASSSLRRDILWAAASGDAGSRFLTGDSTAAMAMIDDMLETGVAAEPEGSLRLIGYNSGAAELLSVAAAEALRSADVVFHNRRTPADILEITRREATLTLLDENPVTDRLIDRLGAAVIDNQKVVLLGKANDSAFQTLFARLRAVGVDVRYLPSAAAPDWSLLPAHVPAFQASGSGVFQKAVPGAATGNGL